MSLQRRDSLSDEELVSRSLEDKEYFGVLIDRYADKLQRYIWRLGIKSVDDQQDVLQEVFLKAYRNLTAFDTRLAFSSWIYRITHNETISWYRKHKVRPEGNMIADGEEIIQLIKADHIDAEKAHDVIINAKEVERALLSLDQKYKEVIILRYFEHKEYEEISDILKIPTGSVGTLLFRGKKQLKKALNTDALRI